MRFHLRHVMLAALPLALMCLGQVKLVEDPPVAHSPRAGDITGTVAPAGRIAQLSAVHRNTGKAFTAESFNKATGKFAFRNLPGDAAYDLRLKLDDGTRVEGIDLGFVDERMLRLADLRRKQLVMPAGEPGEFTQADADAILKYAADLKDNDFMDRGRVLYLSGKGKRATMLIERLRTRDFHSGSGQIVWRVELWYFENRYGGWDRVANEERVLERVRSTPAEWSKVAIFYLPQLSVRLDENGKCEPVDFELPAKFDPSTGRPSDSPPDLQTPPHVMGLDRAPAADLQAPQEK